LHAEFGENDENALENSLRSDFMQGMNSKSKIFAQWTKAAKSFGMSSDGSSLAYQNDGNGRK
jgi:hypothetical protein